VLNFLKSGSHKLLEPSGLVKACNGIVYLYLLPTIVWLGGRATAERKSVLAVLQRCPIDIFFKKTDVIRINK
jgi:uncharacterized protein YbjT (DUF2867 family)